jgi:hypothetical protein
MADQRHEHHVLFPRFGGEPLEGLADFFARRASSDLLVALGRRIHQIDQPAGIHAQPFG